MTTYLSEFEKVTKNGVAYIPLGTIEWHGSHLPIETDFLIAQKICELSAENYPGYILPPFYLGSYGSSVINGKEMRGMDRKLGKKLSGNLYFLEPFLFGKTLRALTNNLKDQGFNKIIIISGHGGENQLKVLESINDEKVISINPYAKIECHHADEVETSILWACYPEEEAKAKEIKTPENDDLSNYRGYDVLAKSSLDMGKENLEIILKAIKEEVKEFLTG